MTSDVQLKLAEEVLSEFRRTGTPGRIGTALLVLADERDRLRSKVERLMAAFEGFTTNGSPLSFMLSSMVEEVSGKFRVRCGSAVTTLHDTREAAVAAWNDEMRSRL